MGKFRARPEPLLYGNSLINHRLFKHIIKLSFPRGEKHWVLVRLDSSMKRFQPKIELLFWLSALVSFCLSVHFSLPAVTVGNGQIPCFDSAASQVVSNYPREREALRAGWCVGKQGW